MGVVVDGVWHVEEPKTRFGKDGSFVHPDSVFRNWVTADGRAGPSGEGGFAAAAGRYHLYICWACPWAHRTMLVRRLKGLEDAISYSVVNLFKGDDGWTFDPGTGVVPDPVYGVRCLHELYTRTDPRYTGRVSVPVLFDRERKTIVSNESSEIIVMFNAAFDAVAGNPTLDLYPAALRPEIDALNERIFATVNEGVYRSGFAASQEAYDSAVGALFETLDFLDDRLSRRRYLVGDAPTLADWRLFPTLARFDMVYHGHFKCNLRRLTDYPNLWAYTRELYQMPGIAEIVKLEDNRWHYYASHANVNPTRIVPRGPAIDFTEPHGRGRLAAAA